MPQEYKLLLKHADQTDYSNDLECYQLHGGYEALRQALAIETEGDNTPQSLLRKRVLDSGLRGRGGAGFSCGLKWSFVRHPNPKPVYLICNADESEPGTFKDRQIIYKDPHQLIEGMIISCWANHVNLAYIYIRGEFTEGAQILNKALNEARSNGYLGKNILDSGFDLEIHVHRGAGAYICGEETGLIESLEGKRAYPRIKPPYFPAALGLYMCPTIVNNVETLTCVPFIFRNGAERFVEIGTPKQGGTRLFCVCGHVNQPGVYEEPVSITLKELIEKAGGVRDGRKLKAVIPGGISAKVLTADEVDVAMDFDSLLAAGTMAGSGGVIVMDETTCMVEALDSASRFFADESCGQCSPCREGTGWIHRILRRIIDGRGSLEDLDKLLAIAGDMEGKTICVFADAAAWPVQSYIEKFRDEFEQYIRSGASEEKKEREACQS